MPPPRTCAQGDRKDLPEVVAASTSSVAISPRGAVETAHQGGPSLLEANSNYFPSSTVK